MDYNISYDPGNLYQDIQSIIYNLHISGQLHNEVASDMGEEVEQGVGCHGRRREGCGREEEDGVWSHGRKRGVWLGGGRREGVAGKRRGGGVEAGEVGNEQWVWQRRRHDKEKKGEGGRMERRRRNRLVY